MSDRIDRARVARKVAGRLGIDSEVFAALCIRVCAGERILFDIGMPAAARVRLTRLLQGAVALDKALPRRILHDPRISDQTINGLAAEVGRAIRRDPIAEQRYLKSQR
ncbi:hypothetical protein ACEUZ9_002683 [Paracoccus litorisediminis]|uniref:hypothetical protein n=1 Tax=Paracoccus litorisediminis TaxID=2006130 RepID=UPI00372E1F7A